MDVRETSLRELIRVGMSSSNEYDWRISICFKDFSSTVPVRMNVTEVVSGIPKWTNGFVLPHTWNDIRIFKVTGGKNGEMKARFGEKQHSNRSSAHVP